METTPPPPKLQLIRMPEVLIVMKDRGLKCSGIENYIS